MTEATYQDEHLTIYAGDCRAVLASLPEESVHAVVTSPPYYGLRDYGIEPTAWGGDPDHAHEWSVGHQLNKRTGGTRRTREDMPAVRGVEVPAARGEDCRCGAWLGVLGLEPDPFAYLDHLVEVFREVRRVLRRDGTLWLNLGDSYAAKARGSDRGWETSRLTNPGYSQKAHAASMHRTGQRHRGKAAGFKAKDRMMIPARSAIALADDGWWLRDEVVWSKPNPMPSSVADPTTPAHEMVYLLARSARYYFDAAAIREGMAASSIARINQSSFDRQTGGPKDYANGTNPNQSARKALENIARKHRRTPAGWNVNHDQPNTVGRFGQRKSDELEPMHATRRMVEHTAAAREADPEADHDNPFGDGRNKRSVWTVPTEPYPEAHFATFPERLIEPMILASVPPHVCAGCGAPWSRTSSREVPTDPGRSPDSKLRDASGLSAAASSSAKRRLGQAYQDQLDRIATTYGPWTPGCGHEGGPVGGVVLDPFGGSGTVAVVAQRLGRRAELVDLSPEYVEQMVRRIAAGRSAGEGPAVDMPVPFAADGLWGDA